MAKLTGVTTIDMVNGAITKVAYGGAEYAKVSGVPSEEVKIGDIALCANTRSEYFSGGSYYLADCQGVRHVLFRDNLNDHTAFSNIDERVTLFRKVAAQTTPTIAEVSAKVDGLAERVDALESGKSEELRVGDRVEIVDARNSAYNDLADGDIGTIVDTHGAWVSDGMPYRVDTEEDYDHFPASALRKVAKPSVKPVEAKPITEGDIVVITANTNSSRNKFGDIGKVGTVNGAITKYAEVDVPQRPWSKGENGNVTKLTEMRPATPAEIADYYQAYAEANKPKLNVGDYAVVTGVDATRKSRGAHAFNIGEIVELKSELSRGDGFNVGRLYGKSPLFQSKVDTYDLRKATEEEVAEAEQERKEAVFTQAGRKPNEYRKGDIVRTIYVEGGIRNGHEPGLIGEVTRDTIVISKKSRNPEVLIDGESLRTNVEPVTFVESRLDRN